MKSVLLTAALLLAALPIYPQTAPDADQAGAPPARVARLNWISGDVSFQPAGIDDWTDATVNYPLTTSDHLVTGNAARAELHIGPNSIRLAAGSNFGFLNLDDSAVQVSLTQGSLEIRLRQLDESDSFEVDTPNGAITLLRTGDYRIDTDAGRDATMLTVRSGQADLLISANGNSNSVIVRSGQTAYIQQEGAPDIRSANEPDDFDAFTLARNDAEDNAPHNDYVPQSMAGAEDLDTNGSWQNDVEYGPVWVPPVSADWIPYSTGRWAFVEPWGWTWIDDASWGFAPFHYGRWAFASGRWVWIPGRNARAIYSPALVVFVEGEAGVSWFPLGPRDPVRGGANVLYANRFAPHAVVTMSRADFAGAGRVRPGVAGNPAGEITGSAPRITPHRESVLIGSTRTRPAAVNRPLTARTPPPPPPVSFEARQQALSQNQGRPLAPRQVDDLRRQQPSAVMPRPAMRSMPPQQPPVRDARPVAPRPEARPAPPKPAEGRPAAPSKPAQ